MEVLTSWPKVESLLDEVHPDDRVLNTIQYLFFRKRCAVYVRIRNNSVVVFAPFANLRYSCPYALEFESAETMYKVCSEPNAVHPSGYWLNGDVLCSVQNPTEPWSTSMLADYKQMLEAAAALGVPDVDFFLNKRDFPLLPGKGAEDSYAFAAPRMLRPNLWKDCEFSPVLSCFAGDGVGDTLMPMAQDWTKLGARRACPAVETAWGDMRAVFRGSCTNATRVELCQLSARMPDVIDAGLTSMSKRFFVRDGVIVSADMCSEAEGRALLRQRLSREEQGRYLCNIVVDGHAGPNRLSWVLQSNSVTIRVRTAERMRAVFGETWIEQQLREIPAEDLVRAADAATGPHRPCYVAVDEVGEIPAVVMLLRRRPDVASAIVRNAHDALQRLCVASGMADVLRALPPSAPITGNFIFGSLDPSHKRRAPCGRFLEF